MYYLIYRITNKLNNKIYIGSHKTKNKDDGYMGSGKYLNRAYEKYGLENFTKEILFEFDNSQEMYDKEAELVNEDFLMNENTYNLKRGGFGGFDYINENGLDIVGRTKGHANRTSGSYDKMREGGYKGAQQLKLSGNQAPGRPWSIDIQSFAQSDQAKRKRKETLAKIDHQQGEKNSQFGKCWIKNNIENKKIRKDQLDFYLQNGWIKGRNMSLSSNG